ncbi:MAG TPA: right-handed parallel beta-helix repeat-containing protein, partial [Armatimonadota bacterium]
THAFGLENLTLYATNYTHFIVADQGADAGDVFLRKLRVRGDIYRGHLTPEQITERYTAAQRVNSGDTLRLGGKNVEVTDCDIYGSGRALYISHGQGARIENNLLYNGRGGWYCISGSDGVIFANNRIVGADMAATGGGINCLDGSCFSQNVYYAHNSLSLMHGWDREAMTSDAGGGLYIGGIAGADATRVALLEDPKPGKRDWAGAAVFIHNGRGQGQYRRVKSIEGKVVTVDQPWAVPPDATSTVGITMLQRRYLLIDNEFTDTGVAIQFYGCSVEHMVVGNRCARAGGYVAIGKPYGGYNLPPEKNPCQQPTWYCQFLDNRVLEGNNYRSGSNNSDLSADTVLAVYGWPATKEWKWPLARGATIRRNVLDNNARIVAGNGDNPIAQVVDILVEGNRIANCGTGITVGASTAGIYLRNNRFDNVAVPFDGPVLEKAALAPDQRAVYEQLRKK